MLKKAQESAGKPVDLVLVLAAIVVAFIVIFGYIIPRFVEKLPDKEACRLSVIARSRSHILKTESDIPLNCHTNMIEVKKEGIYRDGKIDVVFTGKYGRSEKEEKIKKYVADQMYDCWYQFNEGQSDAWGDWNLGTTLHCVICADINFDPEFNEQIGKIGKFEEFLNEEPISRTSETTYAEYLGGKIDVDEEIYIDTSQPHLVLYRLEDIGLVTGLAGATGAGCGGGAVATWAINLIPGIGQLAWATGVGGGCIIGFAGGAYRYVFSRDDPHEIQLRSSIVFAPAEAISTGVCSVIG